MIMDWSFDGNFTLLAAVLKKLCLRIVILEIDVKTTVKSHVNCIVDFLFLFFVLSCSSNHQN